MHTENTPIPPGIEIKVLPAGVADGVEPNICRSTGRKGAPQCLFNEPVSIGKGKYAKMPRGVFTSDQAENLIDKIALKEARRRRRNRGEHE